MYFLNRLEMKSMNWSKFIETSHVTFVHALRHLASLILLWKKLNLLINFVQRYLINDEILLRKNINCENHMSYVNIAFSIKIDEKYINNGQKLHIFCIYVPFYYKFIYEETVIYKSMMKKKKMM